MTYLAQAAALQESGLLVSGMSVTDLSTGFSLTGGADTREADFLTRSDDSPGGDLSFRGTNVKIAKLELLAELVHQVLEQREDNAEWASVNPPEPRAYFPWGLDLEAPDVLVAGDHADTVASYLRRRGMRARPIDETYILTVADALVEAEEELGRLLAGELSHIEPSEAGLYDGADDSGAEVNSAVDLGSDVVATNRSWVRAAGFAAVAVVCAMVIVVGTRGFVGQKTVSAGSAGAAEGSGTATEQTGHNTPEVGMTGDNLPETTEDPAVEAEPSRDPGPLEGHRRVGHGPDKESGNGRAAVPVTIDVPGFTRSGATEAQEQFTAVGDPNFRILVAATPTPLESQEELDDAVLREVALHEGISVVSTAPVSYREVHPESSTVWHVRLRDGHQVSIGCQSRGAAPAHNMACEKAANTARVE